MENKILEKILKKCEESCNPSVTRATICNLETLYKLLQKDKLTQYDIYKLKTVIMFINFDDLFPQTESISYNWETDDPTPFVLGEILMNSHGNKKWATELRCKAFYRFLAVGDILVLQVNEITDLEYKQLIIYKQSLKFKIEDLKLVAVLSKIGSTIKLEKGDYIKAAVQGCASDALIIIVSLDESIVNHVVKPVKLGKISKNEASVDLPTTQHKYFSQYLNSSPDFKFNATKWKDFMKEFGVEPYLKCNDDEQGTRPFKKEESCSHSAVHEWKKRLEIDSSDESARKNMAKALHNSAKKYEQENDLERAFASVRAAKSLWEFDQLILYHDVLKIKLFRQFSGILPENSKNCEDRISAVPTE